MFCRLFRFMISSAADSGKRIGPVTSRHVARCESCRQFLQSCRQIAERLQSEASEWERGSGPLCRPLSLNTTRMLTRSHGFPIRVALAAVACIAIIAAVTLSLVTSTRRPQAPAAPVGVAMPAGTQWTMRWVEIVQTPLAAEAENLTNDAKSGIRFLAACLDVRPLGDDISTRPPDAGTSSLR
jgi:hypothetical protein